MTPTLTLRHREQNGLICTVAAAPDLSLAAAHKAVTCACQHWGQATLRDRLEGGHGRDLAPQPQPGQRLSVDSRTASDLQSFLADRTADLLPTPEAVTGQINEKRP